MALRGTLIHHKTMHLAALLKIPPCFALGLLEALWHTTGAQAPHGNIGKMTNLGIASVMLYPGNPEELVRALIEAGFLDEDRTHRLIVHNWHKHADDHVHARLYRSLERFANGAVPKQKKVSREEKPVLEQAWRDLMSSRPKLLAFEAAEAAPQPTVNVWQPAAASGSLPEPEPEPVPEPTTPLPPPAAGGSRRQMERAMEQNRSSPEGQALDAAADQVLRACSVSGVSAVRLKSTVYFAIEGECHRVHRSPTEHAQAVGELMAANYAEYVRAGPELAYRWGVKRFFGDGLWRNWQLWPIDQDKARARNAAGVGMYVN